MSLSSSSCCIRPRSMASKSLSSSSFLLCNSFSSSSSSSAPSSSAATNTLGSSLSEIGVCQRPSKRANNNRIHPSSSWLSSSSSSSPSSSRRMIMMLTTNTTRQEPGKVVVSGGRPAGPILSSRSFSSTPTAEPASPAKKIWPPPIIWTTHKLKPEQIRKVDQLFHKILWLDMFETHMLTELLQERLGLTLTPAQRRAYRLQLEALQLAGGGGSSAAAATEPDTPPPPPAPTLVDLKLVSFDDKAKIKIIKEVRALAGLGLKEAKELVEKAPQIIHKDLSLEQAEEWHKKLIEAGANVEMIKK